MSRLKICGTTNLEDALFCDNLKVDFLGFIFHPKSKRFISPKAAKPILNALKHSKAIGLFVDEPSETVINTAKDLGLWGVQIYEDMIIPPQQGIQSIRAYHVDEGFGTISTSAPFDYTLLDTPNPNQLGGTGQSFDWRLLPKDLSQTFLAGGINIGNIHEALSYKPFAIDLVSGVEAAPGKKDFTKVKKIVEAVYG